MIGLKLYLKRRTIETQYLSSLTSTSSISTCIFITKGLAGKRVSNLGRPVFLICKTFQEELSFESIDLRQEGSETPSEGLSKGTTQSKEQHGFVD